MLSRRELLLLLLFEIGITNLIFKYRPCDDSGDVIISFYIPIIVIIIIVDNIRQMDFTFISTDKSSINVTIVEASNDDVHGILVFIR